MKKIVYLLVAALVILSISGCADCNKESDYDYVGITVNDFTKKAKIKSTISNQCNQPEQNEKQLCSVIKDNLFSFDFSVNCSTTPVYSFNLKDEIHKLFPMEAYKDDKYEQCEDYYVYDFLSEYYRSENPSNISKVIINKTNPNIWYLQINAKCYEWDMTTSPYKVNVTNTP